MKPGKMAVVLLCTFLTLGTAMPSNAILIRHDRDDAAYQELAGDYPAVCEVGAGGVGVLVAPQWVLTVAHVADGVRAMPEVRFGEKKHLVKAVFQHPEFRESGRLDHDIGLLRLAAPVDDIKPVRIYAKKDEVGQTAVLVGSGDFGNRQAGTTRNGDGILRAATNIVASADALWLTFVFDPPESATDLEGTPGGNDSGCPALVLQDGELYTLGVGSHARDRNKDGLSPAYGDEDRFTRASTHGDWIGSVMGGNDSSDAVSGNATFVTRHFKGERASAQLPETAAAKVAKSYFEAFNSGKSERIAAFLQENCTSTMLGRRTLDERRELYTSLLEQFGTLKFTDVLNSDETILKVLVQPARSEMTLVFQFTLEQKAPHKLDELMVASVDP